MAMLSSNHGEKKYTSTGKQRHNWVLQVGHVHDLYTLIIINLHDHIDSIASHSRLATNP